MVVVNGRIRFDPCIIFAIYLILKYATRRRPDWILIGVGLAILNQHVFRHIIFSLPRPIVVAGAFLGVWRGMENDDWTVYGPMMYSVLSKFCPHGHGFIFREQIVAISASIALMVLTWQLLRKTKSGRRRKPRTFQRSIPRS